MPYEENLFTGPDELPEARLMTPDEARHAAIEVGRIVQEGANIDPADGRIVPPDHLMERAHKEYERDQIAAAHAELRNTPEGRALANHRERLGYVSREVASALGHERIDRLSQMQLDTQRRQLGREWIAKNEVDIDTDALDRVTSGIGTEEDHDYVEGLWGSGLDAARNDLTALEVGLVEHPEFRIGNKVRVHRSGRQGKEDEYETDWTVDEVLGNGKLRVVKEGVGHKDHTINQLLHARRGGHPEAAGQHATPQPTPDVVQPARPAQRDSLRPMTPEQARNAAMHAGWLAENGATVNPADGRLILSDEQLSHARQDYERNQIVRAIAEFRKTAEGSAIAYHRAQLSHLARYVGDALGHERAHEAGLDAAHREDQDHREAVGWARNNGVGINLGALDRVVRGRGSEVDQGYVESLWSGGLHIASSRLEALEVGLIQHPEFRVGNKAKVQRTGKDGAADTIEDGWEVRGVVGNGQLYLTKDGKDKYFTVGQLVKAQRGELIERHLQPAAHHTSQEGHHHAGSRPRPVEGQPAQAERRGSSEVAVMDPTAEGTVAEFYRTTEDGLQNNIHQLRTQQVLESVQYDESHGLMADQMVLPGRLRRMITQDSERYGDLAGCFRLAGITPDSDSDSIRSVYQHWTAELRHLARVQLENPGLRVGQRVNVRQNGTSGRPPALEGGWRVWRVLPNGQLLVGYGMGKERAPRPIRIDDLIRYQRGEL